MRWLGMDWDEGVEVGGPHEPYRQWQRLELYADVAARLVESGFAYESYSSAQEGEARHLAAGRDPKIGYEGFDRDLSEDQFAKLRAKARSPVLPLCMADAEID